ncbi:ABC-type antimicrobial peptide transport system, permease component [Chitinophaga eiseniae]|uniref:ABC-type antimicrobial peptide transport system, permease component n=1 Tax=Chitinophaga eiseniae TaxID=634771 RepID=A0A1T4T8I6_9BACT|nr:ABC transporter permease [Chitinophaga eiseniae]SKA36830.1 ABC-type antimicrobial peptide transport system, permease component [Chitinophaga eiseniae]
MIKNYFLVAWRNLLNNKGYSAINIFGLAAGMAVAMVIALWVVHEYSYDRFMPDRERIFRVQRNFDSNGDTLTFRTVSLKLAQVLRSEIPEMEYVSETDWMTKHALKAGERKVVMNGGAVQEDFLKIFGFRLLQGNVASVFKDPFSIVLTQSAAEALFGKENPVGRMVRLDNQHDLAVTGVLQDLPANSSFQFKYLIPFNFLDQTSAFVREDRKNGSFGNNGYQLFVKLQPGVNAGRLAAKIAFIQKREKESTNAQRSTVILQAMDRWRLFSEYKNGKEAGGFIDYIRIFSGIGILVLVIAGINFVNLTTARSEKRAREVGIRKAVGSRRRSLVIQFLTESLLLTFIALLCSFLVVVLVLPAFNRITGAVVRVPFEDVRFWAITLAGVSLVGIAAGLKPAFYLSSFNPVKTMKGSYKTGTSAVWSRRGLVVVQFTCSVVLVISTMVIYRQMQYAKDRPTGFETDRLMMSELTSDMWKNNDALKQDLLQSGLVSHVSVSSSPPVNIDWHSDLQDFPGKLAGETVEMGMVLTADDYVNTMGMTMSTGRDFRPGMSDTLNVILNEAAVKRLRLKDPLSASIKWNDQWFRVIGVVRNALMLSPFQPADPTLFMKSRGDERYLLYQLAPGVSPYTAVDKLGAIFTKHNPAYPYVYEFANEAYNQKFRQEMLTGRLSGIFAVLAILISCLGLLGLAAYMAEQRTKEIGVRKVLGATITQVWFLLSKDFIVLVLVSCLIATPVALYFLQRWLMQYDYRITLGPGVFLLAAVIALVITLGTVSFQAIKAAMANPVRSLRSE